MANELVVQGGSHLAFGDMEKLAENVAKCGLFAMKTKEQALAMMALCQAKGLHPMTAVERYHIIQGRPAMRSDAMLADFQASGGKVQWLQRTDSVAEAEFSHPSGGTLKVRWTLEDAKRAGLSGAGKDNWQKYPRQMLSARVVSEGVRAVFPAVVQGMYAPEEVMDFEDKPKAQLPTPFDEPDPLVKLNELMESDGISQETVLAFCRWKGMRIGKNVVALGQLPDKVLKRLTEVWKDVLTYAATPNDTLRQEQADDHPTATTPETEPTPAPAAPADIPGGNNSDVNVIYEAKKEAEKRTNFARFIRDRGKHLSEVGSLETVDGMAYSMAGNKTLEECSYAEMLKISQHMEAKYGL